MTMARFGHDLMRVAESAAAIYDKRTHKNPGVKVCARAKSM